QPEAKAARGVGQLCSAALALLTRAAACRQHTTGVKQTRRRGTQAAQGGQARQNRLAPAVKRWLMHNGTPLSSCANPGSHRSGWPWQVTSFHFRRGRLRKVTDLRAVAASPHPYPATWPATAGTLSSCPSSTMAYDVVMV